MQERHLAVALHRALQDDGPVALTGPRQAGKRALARNEFPRRTVVDLAQAAQRQAARHDPGTFLRRLRGPAVILEAHRAPELIAATGQEPINHLLIAPRKLGLERELHLLAPSLGEREGRAPVDPLALGISPTQRQPPSISLARAMDVAPPDEDGLAADLATIVRPHDTDRVLTLLRHLSAQPFQVLDLSALALETGVTHTTIARWVQALESLFVVATVPAHESSEGPRLVQRRKLFWLAPEWIPAESRWPAFAAAEIWKSYWHRGEPAAVTHWRTATGTHESTMVLHGTLALTFAPIPAAPPGALRSLQRWREQAPHHTAALVTTGRESQLRQGVAVHPWFAL